MNLAFSFSKKDHKLRVFGNKEPRRIFVCIQGRGSKMREEKCAKSHASQFTFLPLILLQ
jgi:hypothetical protein